MKTLAVINIKGGVGKTISAVNIAAVLAEQGKRVLVCDLDPQANATQLLNCYNCDGTTIENVFLEKGFDIHKAVIKTEHNNLSLVRSHINFSFAENKILIDTTRQQQTRLSKALQSIQDEYDFCILDCPPNVGIITINALVAADDAIVPIKIDQFALDGLDYLLKTVIEIKAEFNDRLNFIGSFVTMDNNTNVNKNIKEQLYSLPTLKMFDAAIRQNVKVPESTFNQKPIVCTDKSSAAAKGYYELTREYLARSIE